VRHLVDDVEALRRHLNLTEINLLAHSAGGDRCPVRRLVPEHINRLVLVTPRHRAARPRLSIDVQFSLKTTILHSGVFRWTNRNGGQNGGQTHSQPKRRDLLLIGGLIIFLLLFVYVLGGTLGAGLGGPSHPAHADL
jgi:pimeloyl-ACP methyl ester carboxylesterase